MAAVYLFDLFFYPVNHISLSSLLAFDRSAILRGQIWRIVTFVFIPPNSSPFFIFLSLYFYWLIGSSLENQWGAFRFNVFYLCGVIGTMLFGFITGYATNYYLNLSLFFAFALIFPDFQLMLFFILPVKVKYLALLDAIGFLWMLLTAGWPQKIALLVAVGNILLFFWKDFKNNIINWYRRYKFRRDLNNNRYR